MKNPHLVTYFLKTELVDRVSSAAVHNREWYSPFTIYLPVLLAGQGAWLYFGLRSFWKCIRSGPGKVISYIKNNEEILFIVLWIIVPFLVFSISKSRLELYVLPLYGPIALLIARWITAYENITWKRLVMVGVVSAIILVGLKFGIAHFPNRNNMHQVSIMSRELVSRNTEHYVFEEDKLFGMQFYLNGTMQRVTITGQEPWADTSIDDLLSSLRSENSTAEYLILSSVRKAPLIERALSDSDLDVQKTASKHWVWFRLTQKEQ